MTEILVESPMPGVALLRINRPDAMNALRQSVRDALTAELDRASADPEVRVIVITGDEKAFAAGADIRELGGRTVHGDENVRSRVAWDALERCRKPLIAAINGFALGGGFELALHCDIIIAGEGAKVGLPEVKLGILPGAGGTQRMMRTVGKYQTLRYVLTGDFIPARQAYEMGLVSEVVADDQVLPHALKIASKLAVGAPLAIEFIKEVVKEGGDTSLEMGLLLERRVFQLLLATEDRSEGVAAFLEKRKPSFKGR